MLLSEKKLRHIIKNLFLKEQVSAGISSKFKSILPQSKRKKKKEGTVDFEPDFSGQGNIGSRAKKLYEKFYSEFNNKNLAIAVVANAEAESRILFNNNGDGGAYAKRSAHLDRNINSDMKYSNGSSIFVNPDRGPCCSFGLFQYNICASNALGSKLLKEYGVENTKNNKDEVIKVLIDYDNQVNFMIETVKKVFGKDAKDETISVEYFVENFVKKIENPANPDEKTIERIKIAKKYMKNINSKTKEKNNDRSKNQNDPNKDKKTNALKDSKYIKGPYKVPSDNNLKKYFPFKESYFKFKDKSNNFEYALTSDGKLFFRKFNNQAYSEMQSNSDDFKETIDFIKNNYNNFSANKEKVSDYLSNISG